MHYHTAGSGLDVAIFLTQYKTGSERSLSQCGVRGCGGILLFGGVRQLQDALWVGQHVGQQPQRQVIYGSRADLVRTTRVQWRP